MTYSGLKQAWLLATSLLLLLSCARSPIKDVSEAMRLTDPPESLNDDLGVENFCQGLNKFLLFWTKKNQDSKILTFGQQTIKAGDYIKALAALNGFCRAPIDPSNFWDHIKKNFDFYEVYGKKQWGEVFVTAYYEPRIQGSMKKTARFTQALYRLPDDIVFIKLQEFIDKISASATLQSLRDQVTEQKSRDSWLRGRLIKSTDGSPSQVVPYFSRQDIDENKILEKKKLEIVWTDPIDAFFLHIQGSGLIDLEGEQKSIRVGYAGQNGHRYLPIGKFLTEHIPMEKMNQSTIVQYLKTLSPKDKQKIMNQNPSYVFFHILKGQSITYSGSEVINGRTVATDQRFFPKGSLAFLEFDKPQFETPQSSEPKSWTKATRLVFDEDTGGAIRGPDRLDLFLGQGEETGKSAGTIKHWGRLWYLLPKKHEVN